MAHELKTGWGGGCIRPTLTEEKIQFCGGTFM